MIYALLIGRKGSKGFPGKNTYKVMGKPLCYYPSMAAKKTNLIDDIYFSTDCPSLKKFSEENKFKTINSPPELATSDSNPEEVFLHGYHQIQKDQPHAKIEFLVLLMANCVTITSETICRGIEILRENPHYDSAITVSSYNSYSPHRARRIDQEGLLQPFIPFKNFGDTNKISADRNSMGSVWFADMGVSIVRPHCLINWENGMLPQKWMGEKIYPIKQTAGFDIDYDYEIPLVESWLIKFGGYK